MQLSTKYCFAFLCMPKCASTSIETAIKELCKINFSGKPQIKHLNAQVFTEKILPICQSLSGSNRKIESFCMMRDPLEWIESWYRYRTRNELKNPCHPNHNNYTGNISYSDFIKAYISKGEKKSFSKIKTQYDFLKLSNGHIGVDHIFPLDRIYLVEKFLSEKTQTIITIPKVNVSPKKPITLERNLEEELQQYLAKDIAVYEFIQQQGSFNKPLHAGELFTILSSLPRTLSTKPLQTHSVL